MRFSDLCRRLGRFFIPARSDTLPPVRVLPLELIGFPLTPFGKPALPLGFFGTVLPPLGAVPLDFAVDGAFVAVKLFGGFGDGAVAGRVFGYGIVRLGAVACSPWQSFLQERPYAAAYRPFPVMESCASNANPLAFGRIQISSVCSCAALYCRSHSMATAFSVSLPYCASRW